jgi:cell division protein FtsL
VAVVKDKATKYANNVLTEFAALNRKLQERDATISAQAEEIAHLAEEIAQLREALGIYEAAPVTP